MAGTLQLLADNETEMKFLSKNHCLVQIKNVATRFLLLPVEEKAELCRLRIIVGNETVQAMNVRLAVGQIDYFVPVDLARYAGKYVLADVQATGDVHKNGSWKDHVCWSHIGLSDVFDTVNREKWRPIYHHTPAYGWMNDPNGLFYKDGLYHLYYQWNPYGSQWENMHWGHSVSRDLVHWENKGMALAPDALGTIFSGCAVVDHENTAGFGKGAVVAFYTSAGESQTQSMAYSKDNGASFVKYDGNPVVTADVPDFRDPHVFWHQETARWVMLLAAGQEMRIYSSSNLKDWQYESAFGEGWGNHDGVWECPDLIKLPVRGTNKEKWMLICNINPGGPFGGNATQYFIGQFDGHRFTCEDQPDETKWMDYGKDHYAAITFDNAPDGRHILMSWMSNWQYANLVPTLQYRSANAVPCDIDLFEHAGKTYVGRTPAKELLALRGRRLLKRSAAARRTFDAEKGAYELLVNINPSAAGQTRLSLQNEKGERVVLTYDVAAATLSVDRTLSGETDFSDAFKAVTTAPVRGQISGLRIFVDKSSVEVFDADGRLSLTHLVFPTQPYNTLLLQNGRGNEADVEVYELR
jgi:fructan beta-(2,6)-fructosidase